MYPSHAIRLIYFSLETPFFQRERLRGELRKDQDSLAEEDTTENAMSTRNENRKAEQVSRGRSLQLKPSTQHQ